MTGTTINDISVTGLKLWPAGYGLPARQKLLELISSAKTEDPLAAVTVITTDDGGLGVLRRLTEVIQADASGNGLRGLIAVSAHSLSGIAEKVLERDPQRLVKRGATDLMLGGAIRKVLSTEAGLFEGVKNHPATEQSLLRVVKELSYLTDDQLKQVEKCSARAKAVVGLYERVCNQLDKHDLYLRANILKQAAERVSAEPVSAEKANTSSAVAVAIKRLGTVVLYLPVELKNHQSELVKALASHTSVHVVAGITGDGKADEQYVQLCGRLGLIPEPSSQPEPVADHIVSVSDADDEVRCVVRAVMRNLVDGVQAKRIAILYPTGVPYARLVADQLDSAKVGWHGSSMHRLSESVVGRFAGGLAELVGTDLGRVPFFEVLSDAPVLFDPSAAGGDSDSRTSRRRGKPVPVSAWERIARAANVISGNDWESLLDHHAEVLELQLQKATSQEDGNEMRLTLLTKEIGQCKQLRDFTKGFRGNLDRILGAKTWLEFSDCLKGVLDEYLDKDPVKGWPDWQQAAAEEVFETLKQLKELATIESETTPEVMCRALLGFLNQPVRKRANLGKGIFVGLLDSGMDLAATHVYVLGMVEGTCPTRRRPDSMITEQERQSLGNALATAADQVSKQHHELQAVLAGARSHQGTTTLLYARGDLRNSANNVPSRWLLNTAEALEAEPLEESERSTESSYFAGGYLDEENLEDASRDKSISGLQAIPSFTGGLLATDFPATRQEFDAAVLLGDVGKTQTPLQTPFQSVSQHELCKPTNALALGIELTAGRRSKEFTRFDGNLAALSDSDTARLRERSLGGAISPSALETWASCPRAYLFGRVLGVNPIEEPELLYRMSPLTRGDIAHQALDKLLKKLLAQGETPGPGRPYTPADFKELSEQVDKALAEQSTAGLGGSTFYAEVDRQRIQDDMAEFLSQDENRDFTRGTVIASELRFGSSLSQDKEPNEVATVSYELANGVVLKLHGSIDRVERVERDGQSQLVVIDYKTGKSGPFKKMNKDDPTVSGTKLQLVVYAIAAASHFKASLGLDDDWPQAVTEAFYWFISAEQGWESVSVPFEPETHKEIDDVLNKITTGITNGMFIGYVADDGNQLGAHHCAYCNPDGLSTRELRKQWELKRYSQAVRQYADMADPIKQS